MDPTNPTTPATPVTNEPAPAASATSTSSTSALTTAPLVADAAPALTEAEIDAAENEALAGIVGVHEGALKKPDIRQPKPTTSATQTPTAKKPDEPLLTEDSQINDDGTETSTNDDPTAKADEAIGWADEERELITTAGYDPDAKFFDAMSADERQQFLSDQLERVNGAGAAAPQDEKGKPAPAKTDPTAATTAPAEVPIKDDPTWKEFVTEFGEAAATHARSAVDTEVQRRLKPIAEQHTQLKQQHGALAQMLEDDHFARALDVVKFPNGVKKNSPVIQQKLRDEAYRVIQAEKTRLGARFDLRKFNMLHALPKAAAIVFNPQTQTAAVQQQQESRRKALRGSPEPVTRKPTTRPALSDDEREDAAAEAALSGKTPAEIAKAYAGAV